MPSLSKTTTVVVILVILLGGAAAFLLFGQDADTTGVTIDPIGPASGAEQVFLNLTAQIDPVAFDTSILNDERFNALMDIRTAIIPESAGRADPFAPLSGTP